MKKDYVDLDQEAALFRFGVIADLVHLPPGTKGLYTKLREKAGKEYVIPGSRRTAVAQETIRDWLKKYRRGGFDALLPESRTDMGKPRKLPRKVADLLLAAKEENPDLTVPMVIKKVRESGRVPDDIRMPQSTVYKLLARNSFPAPDTGMRKTWHHPDPFKAIFSSGKGENRKMVQDSTAAVSANPYRQRQKQLGSDQPGLVGLYRN